jgi:hypothetical protein
MFGRLLFAFLALALVKSQSYAQNVGIGTNTPTGPLSFPSILGNKIVLWGDGNTSHYGLGVQSGAFQVYANLPSDNIVFGSGRSAAFSERMRIINSGADGLVLNGRVTLRNGTSPLNTDFSPGIWLYRSDNSALLGFMGSQNNQNVGFFGGPAGWGFVYDAVNSRVGIGNTNPNAPLAFAPALGKKITLYPGVTGDVGFGVAGNRLQIYSDNPSADVAIGYDAAGVFNERFAFKPNGAIAINGNTGTAQQVIASGGTGSAKWVNGLNYIYSNTFEINQILDLSTTNYGPLPGLSPLINLTKRSKVIVNLTGNVRSTACFSCGSQLVEVAISINNLLPIVGLASTSIPNGDQVTITTGNKIFTLDPGLYTLIAATNNVLGDIRTYVASRFRMTVIIIPEE